MGPGRPTVLAHRRVIMVYEKFVEESKPEFVRDIRFLEEAVCRDETRYFLCGIYVEPTMTVEGAFRGVATDGRRLHIVDPVFGTEGAGILEPGLWRPFPCRKKVAWMAKLPEKEAGTFPNYYKAIPMGDPAFTFTLPSVPNKDRWGDMSHLVRFFREFPEITAINMNFLNSLPAGLSWDVRWWGSEEAVTFTSGTYTAVIQPLRI
jgi:hypothetical protein